MHKQSKRKNEKYIAVEPHLKEIQKHEHHEERAFRRLAQAMGYRLPGADIRRKHEMEQ